MEEDIKELLRKNISTSQESLEILKKLHRDIILRRLFTAVRWLVIIGLLVWGFVELQPLIDELALTLEQFSSVREEFFPKRQ